LRFSASVNWCLKTTHCSDAFQYLAMENISYGDFCWNGECLNCQAWLQNGDKERAMMTCRTIVEEGMKIVRLAEGIDLDGIE